ncbi:MAG: hypothetical protein R2874_16420 [Desulfobacterales bacterium]
MNASYLYSLLAVVVLGLVAYLGAGAAGLQGVFGIFIPYLAVVIFIAGFIYRMMDWAKSPVPFRIPTTCGQQQSLDWIKQNKIDNPSTLPGVLARMFFEIVTFRSLFKNSRVELVGNRISYKWVVCQGCSPFCSIIPFWRWWCGTCGFFWNRCRFLSRPLSRSTAFSRWGCPGSLFPG